MNNILTRGLGKNQKIVTQGFGGKLEQVLRYFKKVAKKISLSLKLPVQHEKQELYIVSLPLQHTKKTRITLSLPVYHAKKQDLELVQPIDYKNLINTLEVLFQEENS